MWPGGFPTGDYVRQARQFAGLSQRDFATKAGISRTTLTRIESGLVEARVDVLERILSAAGLILLVAEETDDGRVAFVPPLEELDGPGRCRDGQGRRYPAHLGLIVEPMRGEWWGDRFAMTRPPETFHRDPILRQVRRSLSQRDVRPGLPPPPWPGALIRAGIVLDKQLRRRTPP
jgi:transcriptional regulator with XRE-family HTH domain